MGCNIFLGPAHIMITFGKPNKQMKNEPNKPTKVTNNRTETVFRFQFSSFFSQTKQKFTTSESNRIFVRFNLAGFCPN